MTTETATPEVPALHAVFFTDGGCRPTSRGMGGWGLHGYLFQRVAPKVGTGCKQLVTDKGYDPKGSGKPDITVLEYVDGFGALPDTTNNYAEVMALIRAFEICLDRNVHSVLILADSKYALSGHKQWMHAWAKSNWKLPTGNPPANVELWKRVYELDQQLREHGVTIHTDHVPGHSGHLGNEIADQLATSGVISGFNKSYDEVLLFSDAKGYWKSERGNNRMLAHPFRYFSTQEHVRRKTDDGRTIYYTGKINRKELEMIGKRISDSSLAVMYLTEPDPALAIVERAFERLGEGRYQGLLIADMAAILAPEMHETLLRFDDRLLVRDFANRRLVDGAKDEMIGQEAYPPRLAFRLVDTLDSLERMFQTYLSGSREIVTATDITDILYECGSAEKAAAESKPAAAKKAVTKLKSSLKPGHRTVAVSANYAKASGGIGVVDLVLTLDQDIPDRNTLAALADNGIKITVITWPESEKAIRYATVIEVNGDAAIWAGAYANLKLVAP